MSHGGKKKKSEQAEKRGSSQRKPVGKLKLRDFLTRDPTVTVTRNEVLAWLAEHYEINSNWKQLKNVKFSYDKFWSWRKEINSQETADPSVVRTPSTVTTARSSTKSKATKTNEPTQKKLRMQYDSNRQIKRERPPLKNGKPHGIYRQWHPNGQLSKRGEFKNGKEYGQWDKWDSEGKLIRTGVWKEGRFYDQPISPPLPDTGVKILIHTPQLESKVPAKPKPKVVPSVNALTQKTIKWARDVLRLKLDEQQADAVRGRPGNILVTARAGSGKTRVLTARALWLQLKCGVSAEQLLLVTFGVPAADEMRKRLKPHVGKEMPHVMNFDSLSWNLVKPEVIPLKDDIKNNQRHLSKQVMAAILEHTGERTGKRTREKILEEYIGEFVKHDKVTDKFLDLVRFRWKKLWDDEKNDWKMSDEFTLKEDKVCLAGDYVKSHGETVIANLLFMNGIKYKYEYPFKVKWDENQQEEGIYQPDFRISHSEENESGVIIEYFGMTGIPAYDEQSAEKRQYWKGQPNWDLIEILPHDLGSRTEEAFERFLLEKLAKNNVPTRKLPSKEILEKIPPKVTVGRWVKPLGSFIMRCRNDRITSSELVSLVEDHDTKKDEEEKAFLSVAAEVYPLYLEKIDVEFTDFKGIMWQAVENIENGKTDWTRKAGKEKGDLKDIRYILIDEFQDLNPPFYALIEAIQKINPKVRVFAVGDDWQAIYGFTQASPKYFKQFDTLFSDSSSYVLRNNYRSHSKIVSVSNALFPLAKDKHAVAVTKKAGQVRFWNLSDFDTSMFRPGPHRNYPDRLVGAAATLVEDQLKSGRNVVMLTRTNVAQKKENIDDFRRKVLRYLSFPNAHEKVEIETVHKYKGLESDAVVVLDVKDFNYPLIHPDWKYQRIFGDSGRKVVQEEKRLFYVLLSRAIKSLDLITAPSKDGTMSPFLKEINPGESYADWKTFSNEKFLEVQVFNGFDVRDILLGRKYKLKDGENKKYWERIVPKKELKDFSVLEKQPWFCDGVEIKVIDEKGECVYKAQAEGKNPQTPGYTVQVSDCYHVIGILKDQKYKWIKAEKYWEKTFEKRELKDFSVLEKQPWFCDGVFFQIIDERGASKYKARAKGRRPWSPKKKRGV